MRVRVELTGRSPLMMSNVRLSDPEDEFAREIKAINDKKDQTDEDRRKKKELQWYGSIYVSHNGTPGPVIPTANLRKCFYEASKVTKDGKKVQRAVLPAEIEVPLIYDGPRQLRELFARPEFVDTRQIGIPGRRTKVPFTRPIFPKWQLTCDFELVIEVLNYSRFEEIVKSAGVIEGLCDNRVNGYGRFEAKITKL